MELSRRDLLKLGLLGSAALYLPVERVARAADFSGAWRSCPTPFTLPVLPPAGARPPRRRERRHADHEHPHDDAPGRRARSSVPRPVAADERCGPTRSERRDQPDDPRRQGPAAGDHPRQRPAGDPSPARLRVVDVRAPARLGLAAAVRRLRERRDQAGPVQALRLPEPAGRADALVPRPRRPPHGARTPTPASPRSTTCTTTWRRQSGIPTGAYDAPLILRDALFAPERHTALGRQRPVEPHGRRDPRQRRAVAGDAGAEAALPLPRPQRVRSRARSTSRSATRARRCG